MSKKKVAGSTMTLKDFHGGSIPSDLPLPSAPGLPLRPSDRPGYDRPVQWGNNHQAGRGDNRARPHTSPAARHFDDKAPFLTHTANIGRNFDEDERKPLDGGGSSAPRRAVSDDSIPRSSPASSATRHEPKRESVSSSGGAASWARQVSPSQGVAGAHPNAWAARKEAVAAAQTGGTTRSTWSGPDAVTKLAHASALEKVSSGRWQSKPSSGYAADTELVRSPPPQLEIDGSEAQTGLETLERPKLKLLPRTKPVEGLEPPVVEPIIQATEFRPNQFTEKHVNLNSTKSGSVSSVESDKQTVERPKLNLKPRTQPVEQLEEGVEGERNSLFGGARPRELVLKDRGVDDVIINHDTVQTAERVEIHAPRTEKISSHANAPRYGERTENHPVSDTWTAKKPERREKQHEIVRTENPAADQRLGRKPDADRADVQRRNWRSNDNNNHNRRNNNRETEKQPQQQPERALSPETWRKPVVSNPKLSSDDGPRYGKVASAVELATSFSKSSVSESKDRLAGQRNLPGRGQPQIPFSRLTSSAPRPQPQINGY